MNTDFTVHSEGSKTASTSNVQLSTAGGPSSNCAANSSREETSASSPVRDRSMMAVQSVLTTVGTSLIPVDFHADTNSNQSRVVVTRTAGTVATQGHSINASTQHHVSDHVESAACKGPSARSCMASDTSEPQAEADGEQLARSDTHAELDEHTEVVASHESADNINPKDTEATTETESVLAQNKDERTSELEDMCISETSNAHVTTIVSIGMSPRQGSGSPQTSSSEDPSTDMALASDASTGSSRSNRKRQPQRRLGQTAGRWTHEEHQEFLEGLKVYGREWKKVADRIPTRTSAQIRSHAQKYFAKLSREESILYQDQSPPVSQQPYAAAPPVEESVAQLPSSVQRSVERILANPSAVQVEVEDTLRQLRERYRQLQIRLGESQQRRHERQGLPLSRLVEDDLEPQDGSRSGANASNRGAVDFFIASALERRKRSLGESTIENRQRILPDDVSSVSSNVSASLASISPKRSFGSEELIALHVLGGTLPRSASNQEFHTMAHLEPNETLSARSRSSSLASDHDRPGSDDDSETKRQRLAHAHDDANGPPDNDQLMP